MIWTQPEDGPTIRVGPESLVSFERSLALEWLLTNGLGGFASSTVVGANSRRYHGLLVAATNPPVGRIVSVAKLEESVRAPHPGPGLGGDGSVLGDEPAEFDISCNQYSDTIHPRGHLHLESFTLGRRPRFRYRLRDLWLEKSLFLVHGANTTVVVYAHLDGPAAELSLRPLIVHRDAHALSRENSALNPRPEILPGMVTLRPYLGLPPIRMAISRGSFLPWPVWYKGLEYPIELERGLDFREDAFSPGSFVLRLSAGEACVLALSTEDAFPGGTPDPGLAAALSAMSAVASEHGPEAAETGEAGDRFQRALEGWAERAWRGEEARQRRAESGPERTREPAIRLRAERARDFRLPSEPVAVAGGATAALEEPAASRPEASRVPPVAQRPRSEPAFSPAEERLPEDALCILARAADQFWARRGGGHTVVAGYPWFTDWGRDAMVSLPGLLLATGRYDLGRDVLACFCQHLEGGTIPNRFPDAGSGPDYHAADATLWMFWAADYYVRLSGDLDFLRGTLYPAFRDILVHHQRGTRHGIRLADDGLLVAAEEGTQLTWMDAKIDDWVVTPRRGKVVEVNALWHFALCAQSAFAAKLAYASDASYYAALAGRARDAFHAVFWAPSLGRFHDVVDEKGPDPSLRPNQVIALSLPAGLVPAERAATALATIERSLVVRTGLRSLAPNDPRYRGSYLGDRVTRDGAYHQGTVWGWLIGPYVSAYLQAHGRSPHTRGHARRLLAPLVQHLRDAGLGTVSEIFDGDPPYLPRGAPAQAWSVSEVARIWIEEGL